jgi:hypothetical protein
MSEKSNKSPMSAWKVIKIVFLAIIIYSIFKSIGTMDSIKEEVKVNAQQTAELTEKSSRNIVDKIPLNPLKLEYTWNLGGFDNVLLISVKIENNNSVNWADPIIYCEVFGGSRTKLGEVKKTLYQVIPAHGTLELGKFNMGLVNPQTQGARCSMEKP